MRRLLAVGVCLASPLLAGSFTGPRPGSELTPEQLLGLWSRFEPVQQGDPVRFYYFHAGGIGLFRYGRLGLTYTRMFRWSLEDQRLGLEFMKTGNRHDVRVEVQGEALVFERDPVMGTRERYRKAAPSAEGRSLGPCAEHPFARMWTHSTKDRTGRQGFEIYQLQAPGIDRRGLGWFHRGDHTEWSTEALSYRATGRIFDLSFGLRGEHAVTPMTIKKDGKTRVLELERDPRNYWHPQRYEDAGPGFTIQVSEVPLPFAIRGHGVCGPNASRPR